MLFYKNRIEEDLVRIQRDKVLFPSNSARDADRDNERAKLTRRGGCANTCAASADTVAVGPAGQAREHFELKDVVAMIVAVFSVIGPYIVVFVSVIGLLALLIGNH
jgi:hypothetical protein